MSDEEPVHKRRHRHRRRPVAAPPPPPNNTRTILIGVIILLVLLLLGFGGYKAYQTLSDSQSAGDDSNASPSSSGGGGGAGGSAAAGRGSITKSSSSAGGSASHAGGTATVTKSTAGGNSAGSSGGSMATKASSGAASQHQTKDASATEDLPAETKTADSTDAPAPTSTDSGGIDVGVSTKKKGVGYNKASYTNDLAVTWAYNWASQTDALQAGIEYIPMMWGEKQTEGWSKNAEAAISGGATHLLGFNEPDLAEQADMTPAEAVSLWNAQMQPFAGGSTKLVSPAVTNGVGTDDAPMGVPWLQKFIEACTDCQIDAVALHWYDVATNTEYFKKYFTESYATLQKPIWITEFMGTGDADAQKTFIEDVVPWLEDQDFIERYAAFGCFADNPIANFVDTSGVLLPLGQAYSDTT